METYGARLGQIVRARREAAGLTVERLAHKACADPAEAKRIVELEAGRLANPNETFAKSLCRALSISREQVQRCRIGLTASEAPSELVEAVARAFRALRKDASAAETETFIRAKLAAFHKSLVQLSRLGIDARKQQLLISDLRRLVEGARFDAADEMLSRIERIRGSQAMRATMRRARGELALIACRPKLAASYFREASAILTEFAPEEAAELRNACAGLLHQHCRATGESLGLAAAFYRENLSYWTRLKQPEKWAMTQNHLATTQHGMAALSRKTARAALLSDAIEGYRAALGHYHRLKHNEIWATLQGNLADALTELAKLGGSVEAKTLMAEALAARRAAQEGRRRAAKPAAWAVGQTRLANTLSRSADLTPRDTEPIRAAVAAEEEALEVFDKGATPLHWAATQNNLGQDLRKQAARSASSAAIDLLLRAAASFRQALEVYDETDDPTEWRAVQHNLALASYDLARRFQGGAALPTLKEGAEACRAALRAAASSEAPAFWARAQLTLCKIRFSEGAIIGGEAGVTALADAVRAAEAASTTISQHERPETLAEIHRLLAAAWEKWAELEPWDAQRKLANARDALDKALKIYKSLKADAKHAAIKKIRQRIIEKSVLAA